MSDDTISSEDILKQIQESYNLIYKNTTNYSYITLKAKELLEQNYKFSSKDLYIFNNLHFLFIDFERIDNPQNLVEQCGLIQLLMKKYSFNWDKKYLKLIFFIRNNYFARGLYDNLLS